MSKQIVTTIHQDKFVIDTQNKIVQQYTTTKVKNFERYLQVYLMSITDLDKLKPTEFKLLFRIWQQSTPDKDLHGNVFSNTTLFKNKVRKSGLRLTNESIDHAVSSLCKKEFLIRICKGVYVLNTKYFYEGKVDDKTSFKHTIEYNNENFDNE